MFSVAAHVAYTRWPLVGWLVSRVMEHAFSCSLVFAGCMPDNSMRTVDAYGRTCFTPAVGWLLCCTVLTVLRVRECVTSLEYRIFLMDLI